MSTPFNILLFAFFSLCFSVASIAQERKLEVKPEKLELLIGEQQELTVTFTGASQDTLVFPNIQAQLVEIIEVVNSSKIDTQFTGEQLEMKVLTQKLLITAFDSGHHPNPPLLAYIGGDSIQSNPFLVSVNTIDLKENPELADIKDIENTPFAWDEWLKANWYWIVVIALLIAALVRLAKYLEKKSVKPAIIEQIAPRISPHDVALNAITALREEKRWQQGDIKGFYVTISTILRTYFEQQFAVPALELTTDEILKTIAHNTAINAADQVNIKNLLVLADLVKFAKEKPLGSENEHFLNLVEAFVLDQKQKELELSAKPQVTLHQTEQKKTSNG